MDIVVLAGGLSPERDVSLSSGCLIANALMEKGHRALLLDLYTGAGNAASFEDAYSQSNTSRYRYAVPESEPDLEKLRREYGGGPLMGKSVLSICMSADVVFIALHGSIGENGQVQAVFDIHGVAYTGTGYAGSLLAMDKCVSKELMCQHGILTPDWVVMEAGESAKPDGIGYPLVMKPWSCGSSIGVSIVDNEEEFREALRYAKRYEDTVLLEKKVTGREFSVGILDGQALPAIEIIPGTGFYDYKNKYQPGLTEEVCPADLPEETARLIRETALRVHRALRLGSYSRVDFILEEASSGLYCLEANTLPGMTPTSLLPQEAVAAGISYGDLCEKIVTLALGR